MTVPRKLCSAIWCEIPSFQITFLKYLVQRAADTQWPYHALIPTSDRMKVVKRLRDQSRAQNKRSKKREILYSNWFWVADVLNAIKG